MYAIVGLGANLGSREAFLRAAIDLLSGEPECRIVALSSIYENDPVGPPQPRYLNAASCIETALDAQSLLVRLQRIEQTLGRERNERWGPRVIDLDMLWSDSGRIETSSLVVPHPRLEERAFALAPLLEVAPWLDAQYSRQLSALNAKLDRVGTLDQEPSWKVQTEGKRSRIEVCALDRADALASALTAMAYHSLKFDKKRSLDVRIVQKECACGEESRTFVCEVEKLARSGFRYCRALVLQLEFGHAVGRLIGYQNDGDSWELTDIEVHNSVEPTGILLSWTGGKF
jgi:2-amino-4-hydroxy-6-hydroxymethyldihydropteridine diphosphokinase